MRHHPPKSVCIHGMRQSHPLTYIARLMKYSRKACKSVGLRVFCPKISIILGIKLTSSFSSNLVFNGGILPLAVSEDGNVQVYPSMEKKTNVNISQRGSQGGDQSFLGTGQMNRAWCLPVESPIQPESWELKGNQCRHAKLRKELQESTLELLGSKGLTDCNSVCKIVNITIWWTTRPLPYVNTIHDQEKDILFVDSAWLLLTIITKSWRIDPIEVPKRKQ